MFYRYFCTCKLVYFDSLIELHIILTIFVKLLGNLTSQYFILPYSSCRPFFKQKIAHYYVSHQYDHMELSTCHFNNVNNFMVKLFISPSRQSSMILIKYKMEKQVKGYQSSKYHNRETISSTLIFDFCKMFNSML